jgi:glutamate-1-semialdehyde 2,1-aminomutase
LKYKTYVTQEMLKEGILASNIFYISASHNKKHFDIYFEKLDDIFYNLSSLQNFGNIDELLEQEVCKSGFGRLN